MNAEMNNDNLPLWKIVIQRLTNPRTWIYPIIVLLFALFLLPRLSKQAAPPPASETNETMLFGGTPQETTDENGDIHHFGGPAPQTPAGN